MNETESINDKFTGFLEEFKDLEGYIQSLLKGKSLQDLSEKISLVEYAKLNTGLAYMLNSLYYMYMKVNGIGFGDHQINEQMELIKKYVQKIQEVVLVKEEERKNPLMVDQAAAERMIRAHLNDQMTQEVEHDDSNARTADNQEKDDLYELDDIEESEAQKNQQNNKKKSKKLHKGSLLPSGAHISWKDQIEQMLK